LASKHNKDQRLQNERKKPHISGRKEEKTLLMQKKDAEQDPIGKNLGEE